MMHFRPPFKWLALTIGLLAISGWGITAEIGDLSTTDASNTARFPEGLLAGSTNDNLRALEGLLARGFKDTVDGVLTTTGSSTALNVTSNRTGTASLYTGLSFRLFAHTTIGDAPTLTFNSVSGARITWPNGTAIAAGDIPQYSTAELVFADHKWRVTSGGGTPLARAFTSFRTHSDLFNATLSLSGTPTTSDGKQIMEATIVPTNGNNNVKVTAVVHFKNPASAIPTCALFKDSEANAIAAAYGSMADYPQLMFSFETPAGSAASQTYKLRCGSHSGSATLEINGDDATETFNSRIATSMVVEEVAQ